MIIYIYGGFAWIKDDGLHFGGWLFPGNWRIRAGKDGE
jgi:hypothetical protein